MFGAVQDYFDSTRFATSCFSSIPVAFLCLPLLKIHTQAISHKSSMNLRSADRAAGNQIQQQGSIWSNKRQHPGQTPDRVSHQQHKPSDQMIFTMHEERCSLELYHLDCRLQHRKEGTNNYNHSYNR